MVRASGICCVFPGCPVYSGLPQYKGVSLFKLPSKAIDRDWKKQLVDLIKKYRVVDKCLQSRIDESKVWICSLHFTESDFEYTRTGLRKLKLFALPTENLPKKSFEKQATVRRQLVRNLLPSFSSPVSADPNPTVVVENVYENFDEFVSYCSKWKLSNWNVLFTGGQCFITYNLENSKFSIPKFEIIVNASLEFTVRLYGWYLPDDHNLYKRHKRSLRNVTLSDFCTSILKFNVCDGISSSVIAPNSVIHAIPLKYDEENQVPNKILYRFSACWALIENGEICSGCKSCVQKNVLKPQKVITPASKFAPLSRTNRAKVILALIKERARAKELAEKVEKLQNEMDTKGITVSSGMANDINRIMKNNEDNSSPFMKLFWKEQKKMSNQGNFVYHPMLIRFCLSLASKSASKISFFE